MNVTYKQMRADLIEYLKSYKSLDVILKLTNEELIALHTQVTKPKGVTK